MTSQETLEKLDHVIAEHHEWSPFENRLTFFCLALCGEAGELANLAKKDLRGDEGVLDRRAKMADELADVGAYAFMIAHNLGIDLHEQILKKVAEVEQRPAFRAWKAKREGDAS